MSTPSSPVDRAVALLTGTRFLVVATSGETGDPWAATVNHVVADDGTLLFCSSPRSLHSRHVISRSDIAATVYHLDPDPEANDSVQLRGHCAPAAAEDLSRLHTEFFTKDFPDTATRTQMTIPLIRFHPGGTHQIYVTEISECWVRDHKAWQDRQEDSRTPVPLDELVTRLAAAARTSYQQIP